MGYSEQIDQVLQLMRASDRTFALTGAGISTESGIPDYRTPGTGLWYHYDTVKVASLSAFLMDPASFYEHNLRLWLDILDAEPNSAHRALTRMEEMGLIAGVITQNIDGLHGKAGSRCVFEIHGHLRTCHCIKCDNIFPFSYLAEQVQGGTRIPLCTCGGTLRPDVVLFEDRMSGDFFRALNALTGCQLLIVAGTSLQVYPAAELLNRARHVVIINSQPTPGDDMAEVVIHGSTGKVFSDILARLKGN